MAHANDSSPSSRGFTLVEVVVGMTVFLMLLIAGSTAVVQTQKMAHSNVMHNTARTVIEGYMEQMKGISYYRYKEAMADPINVPLETMGISALTTTDIKYDDPLFLNVENEKEVLLDITKETDGSLTPTVMKVWVKPVLVDLGRSQRLRNYPALSL